MAVSSNDKRRGHSAHTQDAETRGLPGRMPRPIKITMLGAGSGFTPRLMNDLLRIPGNSRSGTIGLVDIDVHRLRTMEALIKKLVVQLGLTGWRVVASTDRRRVLPNSDYVVNCIEVSGTECVRFDNDIPLKYGVDQCIGDTIGPGGLFKALRTIPVWLEVLRDCERMCPSALVLNYTNPMAMLCTAAGRASSMQVVGLCHSVQGTSHLLADYARVPYDELSWECAGINHLAWFTKLEHRGRDLYPRLKKAFAAELALGERERRAGKTRRDATDIKPWVAADLARLTYRARDLVRKDMCVHFGAFITESSGHLSEYLPYYRKSDAGRAYLRIGYDGGSRFYATNWPKWRRAADRERAAMLRGTRPMTWERSWEYASWIIEAREKGAAFSFHGNVLNVDPRGGRLIDNLPGDACVEVRCAVKNDRIQPRAVGALPPQMAALCASNLAMFHLGAQAAIERRVETAVHALMLDPLSAAVCTPAQIRKMTLEMFAAEKRFLPGFR